MDEPGPSGLRGLPPTSFNLQKPDSTLSYSLGDSYSNGNESERVLREAGLPLDTKKDDRKINIYTDDPVPKWYKAEGDNITQTIVPTKLPKAFSGLPIYGDPCYSDLPKFLDAKIKEFVGLGYNDEQFANLADWCSPERLHAGKDIIISKSIPNQKVWSDIARNNDKEKVRGRELCVVKKSRLRNEKTDNSAYAKKLKYRGIRLLPMTEENANSSSNPDTVLMPPPETLLEPGKDMLFRVRLYRPFPHCFKSKSSSQPSVVRHSVLSCDLVLAGALPLSALRDRIVCANDHDMRLDVSSTGTEELLATAKEFFPSGFLFINNIFYVDHRLGCVDTSEVIRKWAANKPDLGKFPAMDMSKVRLDELNLKLGHPEVYVHQGNCEHLFTFSEIRLVNYTDPLKLSHYPVHTSISQNQTVYCTTCANFPAKWIVTACERVPFDPAFFCESCFKMYLYKDGRKIGTFKAYSYRGNELNIVKKPSLA